MQVVTPGQGSYLMPIIWYFAPPDAKRLDCVNAFTSGIWDREKTALPPLLGEQPPYQYPFSKGVNLWGYKGQCRIGTDDEFANGISQQRATGLPPPPESSIPGCCRPPSPVFGCNGYPEGLPARLNVLILPAPGVVIPPGFESAFEQFTIDNVTPCFYRGAFPPLPHSNGNNFEVQFSTTAIEASLNNVTPFIIASWGILGHFPAVSVLSWQGGAGPDRDLFVNSLVLIAPFPENCIVQPINLSGDVNGSGNLTPAGATVINSLVSIVAPGTVGDSTHVPVVSVDAKGRVFAFSQVPIPVGALSIGDPILGGSANDMLVVDAGGNLAQLPGPVFTSPFFAWSGLSYSFTNPSAISTQPAVSVTDTLNTVDIANGGSCLHCHNVSGQTVDICDGTNAITYQPGNPAHWLAIPPTDVWKALDRLAAWIATNFGGFAPP